MMPSPLLEHPLKSLKYQSEIVLHARENQCTSDIQQHCRTTRL